MRQIQHDENALWVVTSVVDEEAIDHERQIGTVTLINDTVVVRVAQRVDFDLLADPVSCHPDRPRITVGGVFELTEPEQARELADFLNQAATFVEAIDVRRDRRPQLVR